MAADDNGRVSGKSEADHASGSKTARSLTDAAVPFIVFAGANRGKRLVVAFFTALSEISG
ncbi:hypothetical protein [Aquipseudomonas guryensis]|uniref:Uncharacterized protein n=1 Tax=Aquipseudomonas guryensis TaxID=2759165 RepID=A0A7W4DB95_9GAMM|nr:hypothetical protein [Pseudomonas guryensis]MBB1519424.1 hypothetical protein [Pseudomonas guryensis]